MMKIFDFFKNLFGVRAQAVSPKEVGEEKIYQNEEEKTKKKIISIWDIINLNENTQAYHLVSVIRFDEWVTMEEIRRRIFELFAIDYENERSLYPYLKTLVDIGLMETNSVGGKRKWRKKDLLVKIDEEKTETDEIEAKVTA